MHVHNPNDRALPIKAIEYTLEVEGQQFASGESARRFVVPALGDAEFDMNVTTNLAGALMGVLCAATAAPVRSTTAWSARCRSRKGSCAPSRSTSAGTSSCARAERRARRTRVAWRCQEKSCAMPL